MDSDARADQEASIAQAEEAIEQRLHALADALPDPDPVHRRADRISERAAVHARRAAELSRGQDD